MDDVNGVEWLQNLWLQKLREGDSVLVEKIGAGHIAWGVGIVERVTKSQIVFAAGKGMHTGFRVWKKNGRIVGDRTSTMQTVWWNVVPFSGVREIEARTSWKLLKAKRTLNEFSTRLDRFRGRSNINEVKDMVNELCELESRVTGLREEMQEIRDAALSMEVRDDEEGGSK